MSGKGVQYICGKENAEYFCKTKNKKFTLYNLHTFAKTGKPLVGPSTPVKRERSSSSTKSKSQGLSRKQQDILELLKDDPVMRKTCIQKVMKEDGSDNDSSTGSSTKHKNCDIQDSQDPYDL